MRKLFFLTAIFCFSVSFSYGQKIVPRVEQSDSVQVASAPATEIADNEWRILTDALTLENWDKAAFYASGLLGRLKVDNDKKQMARLRYFYLYALAGRILKASDAKKKTDEESAWKEMEKASESFIGKEFVMPPRQYRSNCEKSLNFICRVKDSEKTFKITATNKDGTAIHSFDYITFEKNINLLEYTEKDAFLGGTLKKVEFNDDLTKPWVMYLIFEKGFVRVVVND